MSSKSTPVGGLALGTHLSIGLLIALVLVAAGQPITTDDVWWHLALGDAYAHAFGSRGPERDVEKALSYYERGKAVSGGSGERNMFEERIKELEQRGEAPPGSSPTGSTRPG